MFLKTVLRQMIRPALLLAVTAVACSMGDDSRVSDSRVSDSRVSDSRAPQTRLTDPQLYGDRVHAEPSYDSRAKARGETAVSDYDDFGTSIPKGGAVADRIVSLNPTATEILWTLGVSSRIVGRSSFDEFPAEVRRIPDVGNGIQPNVEAVLAARPTLVVLYATEENRGAAETLMRKGVSVVAVRVDRIAGFERLTRILAEVVGNRDAGETIIDSVTTTLDSVRKVVAPLERVSVVWQLWQSPVIVAGGGSFLSELLEIAGARNVFADIAAPSPQVSIEEIAARDPCYVLTGGDSDVLLGGLAAWQVVRAVREGRVRGVNIDLTGRPSVNLGMAAASLASLLHPEARGVP